MNLSTREPLAIRAAITAAATAVLHVLVVLGALPIDADAEAAIATAVDLVGFAVLVVWTRGKVTPTADPKLDVPAGTGEHRATALAAPEVSASETVAVSVAPPEK